MRTAPRLPEPHNAVQGWRVVIGALLVLMAGFGAINSYAAFAEEIAGTFEASRSAVAFVFALSGGSCFLISAFSGPLADRLGARFLAAAGLLLVGAGLVLAATARSLFDVYLGYGLLTGIGVGFAYVPAMAAVQRAFVTRRGLASGIAVSGIGIGTALVPLGAEILAAFGGWRTAFLVSGAAVALVGCSGALLLPASPALRPQHDARSPLPTHSIVLAWFGTLLVSMPAMLPHVALVGSARDLGLARPDALSLLGLLGIGTILGRFLLAAIADALSRRHVFIICCAVMAGSMAVWAAADGIWTLRGFALVFGAAQGGLVALLPVFIADRFGTAQLGGVMGLLYTSRGVALLAAPPALMVTAEAAGLAVPVLAFGGLGLLGAFTLFRVNLRERTSGLATATPLLDVSRQDFAFMVLHSHSDGNAMPGIVGPPAKTPSTWPRMRPPATEKPNCSPCSPPPRRV
jgi:MFS family permease